METPEQTPVSNRQVWLGVVALVGCATLWSLGGPLIKLLDEAGVAGITIACYRSLFGGLVFLPLALRRWRTLGNVGVGWPIGSVLMFTLMTTCFVIATTETAAANAIILQYTSPIWVFLLARLLLKEHPRRGDGLVLGIAMIGVAVIFAGHGSQEVPALLIGLTSGVGYGALTVALRGLRRVDPRTVVALNFLGSGLLLVPAVAIWARADGKPMEALFLMSAYPFVLMLVLSIVQLALPYLLFSWALRHVEAHRAALILLLEAVLNPVATFLVVGEMVPIATLVGGPLILLSVVAWMVLSWRRDVPREPGNRPVRTPRDVA